MRTLLLIAALLSATGCREGSTRVVAGQLVGAGGAVVAIPGSGLTLEIPAGALEDDTAITWEVAADAPANALGDGYEFGPDGLVFKVPVTLRFTFESGDLPPGTTPEDLRFLTHDGAAWVEVDGWTLVDPSAQTGGELVVELTHFSRYAVGVIDFADAFNGTYGFAADDVYAFGRDDSGNGLVVRWNGSEVVTDPSAPSLPGGRYVDGWGPEPFDLFALAMVGQEGRVYRHDGKTWFPATSHPEYLLDIHGASDGSLTIAVGYQESILEFDGTTWTDRSRPGSIPLYGVAVLDDGAAVAVGNGTTALHRSPADGSWSSKPLPEMRDFYLRSVWARDADHIYAAGWENRNQRNTGVVLHYSDATGWTRVNLPGTPGLLWGITGTATEVLACGGAGTLLLMENGVWSDESVSTTAILLDVWMLDASNVAFVGTQGIFSHPGTGAGEPPAGDPKPILYVFEMDATFNIVRMNEDGSEWTELTNSGAESRDAVWSPDGAKVIFRQQKFPSGLWDIVEMDAVDADGDRAGDNMTVLVEDVFWEDLAWAPAGNRIAYRLGDDIYRYDLDTEQSLQLTSGVAFDANPAWSPDGTRIVFERDGDLYIVDADGTGAPQALTTGADFDENPTWSSNDLIAFVRRPDIWVIQGDGSGERRFVTASDRGGLASAYLDPDWSTDGTKLVFSHERYPDQALILVADLDGNISEPAGQRAPERFDGSGRRPDW